MLCAVWNLHIYECTSLIHPLLYSLHSIAWPWYDALRPMHGSAICCILMPLSAGVVMKLRHAHHQEGVPLGVILGEELHLTGSFLNDGCDECLEHLMSVKFIKSPQTTV